MDSTLFRKRTVSETVDYFRAKLEFKTTPHTLREDMKSGNIFLLDVRDREGYQRDHIPGATNIPLSELPQNYAGLPKDKTIVVFALKVLS